MSDPQAHFDPVIDLREWSAQYRVDNAVARRTAERWQKHIALESLSLHALLISLCESERHVVIRTIGQRTHRGTVAECGSGYVCVRSETGGIALLASRALAAVEIPGVSTPLAFTSDDIGARELRAALAELAVGRPRVRVAAGEALRTGHLLAVGEDVLVLDAEEGCAVLPVAAIDEVSTSA